MGKTGIKEHLSQAKEEFVVLERKLSDPAVIADQSTYRDLAQRYAHLRDLINVGEEWIRLAEAIAEEEEMLEGEEELRDELTEAIAADRERLEALERKFYLLLIPPDPNDSKNAIVEIRAGAGGEESSLFAADLFRMYARYAEAKGMRISLLDSHPTSLGGFKQIVFAVEGKGAYGLFRYESGVHRVQRVPETESSGRIHTSTATVAVLPEAEEVEV
ncbi:peptide chain release factor 1, partial [Candidatus Acetothermia bacterium]